MTISAQITETDFGFRARIHKDDVTLGTKFIAKPVENCAPGWMDRGQAKTEAEATHLALRWAGH